MVAILSDPEDFFGSVIRSTAPLLYSCLSAVEQSCRSTPQVCRSAVLTIGTTSETYDSAVGYLLVKSGGPVNMRCRAGLEKNKSRHGYAEGVNGR